MLKHKIEKFDVRRFMGVLEGSKLARLFLLLFSFGSLYFSFRSSRALSLFRGEWIFVATPRCRGVCRSNETIFSLSLSLRSPSPPPVPHPYPPPPQRELSLRHSRDDLSRVIVSFVP